MAAHVRQWRRKEGRKNYLFECNAKIDMHDLAGAAV
jgi:hypothetical protein